VAVDPKRPLGIYGSFIAIFIIDEPYVAIGSSNDVISFRECTVVVDLLF
jgi:hypothetical protein